MRLPFWSPPTTRALASQPDCDSLRLRSHGIKHLELECLCRPCSLQPAAGHSSSGTGWAAAYPSEALNQCSEDTPLAHEYLPSSSSTSTVPNLHRPCLSQLPTYVPTYLPTYMPRSPYSGSNARHQRFGGPRMSSDLGIVTRISRHIGNHHITISKILKTHAGFAFCPI